MDFSNVPKPAWYAAGGIVAVGLGLAIFRKPKATTSADGGTTYVPAPASSAPSGPSTSIYSPVTTNTETLTYTYAPVTTDNHSVVTTDNHSVVNGAPTPSPVTASPSLTPPATAQPYTPPISAPRPTLAEIQGRIAALSSQWWAASKSSDLAGEQKAHEQAAYYRQIAADAGYGSLVTGKDGYPVLKLPNGSTI